MILAAMIARISAQCPSFETVGSLLNGPSLARTPGALVAPFRFTASPAALTIPHDQMVTLGWSVFVVMAREGANSSEADFDAILEELREGLVSWTPNAAEFGPLNYAGGQLEQFGQGGSFAWRDDYATTFNLRVS